MHKLSSAAFLLLSPFAVSFSGDLPSVASSDVVPVDPLLGVYVGGSASLTQDGIKTIDTKGGILIGKNVTDNLGVEVRYLHKVGSLVSQGDLLDISPYTSIAGYLKFRQRMGDFSPYVLIGYGRLCAVNRRGKVFKHLGGQWGAGLSYHLSDDVRLFADYTSLYSGKGFDGLKIGKPVNASAVLLGMAYKF